MLFDSHAHLNDERFDEDREELIASLKEKQVDLVVNPGADIKSSISSVNLANKYNFIYKKRTYIKSLNVSSFFIKLINIIY